MTRVSATIPAAPTLPRGTKLGIEGWLHLRSLARVLSWLRQGG